jgi:hypothetical protein
MNVTVPIDFSETSNDSQRCDCSIKHCKTKNLIATLVNTLLITLLALKQFKII